MNRNKKGVMPEITREVYKSVKKLDRQQFAGFCTDLYKFGYEDGYEAGTKNAVDIEKIYQVIGQTKGIGPKKLKEIKTNINASLGNIKEA